MDSGLADLAGTGTIKRPRKKIGISGSFSWNYSLFCADSKDLNRRSKLRIIYNIEPVLFYIAKDKQG